MENTVKSNLHKLLISESRLWDEETNELNETLLKDLIDKLDEKLIELLLGDNEIRDKFFIKVKNVFVLKQNELKFFIDENKLDNSYTRYRNRIGLRVGSKLLFERNDIVLDWPFKDCVLEGGMTKEDQKRNEIFFNEVLAKDEIDRLEDPKALINWKRYTINGEEKVKELKRDKDGTIRENLLIKGNNLLAMHSLKDLFTGKVKLIYIDPPYNTGNDSFSYNDAFSRSTWLTFMKNRFETAKDLLSKDGAIIVQISDRQVGYLQVLMDEIFPEGFINKVTVKTRSPSGFKTVNLGVFESAEYLLIYGKNRKLWKYIPQFEVTEYDQNYSFQVKNIDEPYSKWKIVSIKEVVAAEHGFKDARKAKKELGETVFLAELAQYALNNAKSVFRFTEINLDAGKATLIQKEVSLKNPDKVLMLNREKLSPRYILNGQEITFYANKVRELDGNLAPTNMLTNIWTDIPWEGIAAEGGVKLKKGKKPERLLRRLIAMTTDKPTDIVLDFYLGSGTTAAVAHKMGRQYIGIEQLAYEENDSIVRLQNVIQGDQSGVSKSVGWKGGGEFIYAELATWNEEAQAKILKAKSLGELEKLFDELYERYFLNYNVKTKEFKEKIIKEKEFKKLSLNDQKKLFVEMLDMNQMFVNYSERADKKYSLSKEDIALSEAFYNSKS